MSGLPSRPYGFTLVELVVVLSIVTLLAAIAAPRVVAALGRAGLDRATSTVVATAAAARTMAQQQWMPPINQAPARFGVVIVQSAGQQPYVALTFGISNPPLPEDMLLRKTQPWRTYAEYLATPNELDADNQPIPVRMARIGGDLLFHRPLAATPLADQPITGSWGWICHPRRGAIVSALSTWAKPVDIGTSPMLVVRNNGAQLAAAIAIYSVGASHVQTLR